MGGMCRRQTRGQEIGVGGVLGARVEFQPGLCVQTHSCGNSVSVFEGVCSISNKSKVYAYVGVCAGLRRQQHEDPVLLAIRSTRPTSTSVFSTLVTALSTNLISLNNPH